MLEIFLDLIRLTVLLGLAVGFTFGGMVGLVLLAGWVWDKIERYVNER